MLSGETVKRGDQKVEKRGVKRAQRRVRREKRRWRWG